MRSRFPIGAVLALLLLGACSTGQVVGAGAGAAGGYAVDGQARCPSSAVLAEVCWAD